MTTEKAVPYPIESSSDYLYADIEVSIGCDMETLALRTIEVGLDRH